MKYQAVLERAYTSKTINPLTGAMRRVEVINFLACGHKLVLKRRGKNKPGLQVRLCRECK